MSADFNTFIHLKGTKEELCKMLQVVKTFEVNNYKQYVEKHDFAYIDSVQIAKNKKFFFTDKSKRLSDLDNVELEEFLNTGKKEVFVSASGPWGIFGFLDEISLFDEIAEAAPNASFDANITGWNSGGDQDAEFELINGLLYSRYAFHMDDDCCESDGFVDEDEYDDIDKPCEWDTEVIYDPIKKEIIASNYDD